MRLHRALAGLVLGAWLAAPMPSPASVGGGVLDFNGDEIARILQHGPWPPPPAVDPGNRWSAQPAAIALGRQLFFERRLSPDGRMSCATCHVPARAFTDGRAKSQGRVLLDRNAPTL